MAVAVVSVQGAALGARTERAGSGARQGRGRGTRQDGRRSVVQPGEGSINHKVVFTWPYESK